MSLWSVDRTLWPTEGEISFADMSDRPSETILLIEVLPSFIHQMEPRDLTFDEAVDLLTGRTEQSKYLSLLDGQDILVAFADGHVCAAAAGRSKRRPSRS